MSTRFASVAVPSPLRRTFDYAVPPALEAVIVRGCRVLVPFGRTRQVGIVTEVRCASAVPPERLRALMQALDDEPLLDETTLRLLEWAAGYYHHPIGEVLQSALPTLLRQPRPSRPASARGWVLTPAGAAVRPETLGRAPRQADALRIIAATPGVTRADVDASAPGAAGALPALVRKGWISVAEAPAVSTPGSDDSGPTEAVAKSRAHAAPEQAVAVDASLARAVAVGAGAVAAGAVDAHGDPGGAPVASNTEPAVPSGAESGPTLSSAQVAAVERIDAARGFEVLLLDGVTGSGKTEVYLHAAARTLARGSQVLVLVPEIGLTPQMIDRFRRRLGAPMAVLHSALAAAGRRDAWMAARGGRIDVVLGTRSSVFTPLPRLGLIVVDEEHDLSYKQQDGFRYSARDVAVMRARQCGIPAVLGSATPSLESLHNVERGRSTRLVLSARAGGAAMPPLSIVDMRARNTPAPLSPQLHGAIDETLAADGQVLLFVNRRGFAPALICHECGHVHDCPRCDARLVLHRQAAHLRCHHCGHRAPVPRQCAECRSTELRPVGLGTERLEQTLRDAFPDVSIDRIDRDTTRRRGALERRLDNARSGATRILVGTQMLAKGHDFPGVTLVGILDADGGLFSVDFRASERLAQLIVQVSGRAGRAERPGRVLIQTHQPDHALLRALVEGSYAQFCIAALAEREAAAMPPFAALALLRAEAPQPAACHAFLEAAATWARTAQGADADVWTPGTGVAVLGPVPAPMERRQGRYRAQLLLQAATRPPLQRLLGPLADALETMPEARRVRWSLDVDPQDLT